MFTPLPNKLQRLCSELATRLDADPLAHPTPHERRAIYETIGDWDNQQAQRVRAWLAVFAAQRALHVWQKTFPNDDLPERLVDMTVHVLQGRADQEQLSDLSELAYNAAGHCWGYDELNDEITFFVDYAGQSTYHALGGATQGMYFLQNIDTGYATKMSTGFHTISGNEWTNQRLLDFMNPVDSALFAAVALAAEDYEAHVWEPNAWKFFWIWWLSEAIPMAWEEGIRQ